MPEHKKNVILEMPEPATWTFLSFVTDAKVDIAEHWDVECTFAAEQAFRAMLKNCRKIRDHRQWPSWRHPMKDEAGDHGVVELGFKADNRPYRALCKFNGKMCIVLLCICYHKDDTWTPHSAVATATERAKALGQGKGGTNVIKIEDNI